VTDQPITPGATEANAAFDARFASVRDRLLAICIGLVGRERAEDVVHDAYLRGRQRYGQLRDEEAFDAWMARLTVNLCLTLRRRHSLDRAAIGRLARSAAVTERRDVGLRELIEQLPPRERTILVLHYGHGYGLDEISRLLSMRYATVRSVIARTRQRLAKAWLEAHE
jgi:RNA polymerase sigma-70 factor, ECF subfamily